MPTATPTSEGATAVAEGIYVKEMMIPYNVEGLSSSPGALGLALLNTSGIPALWSNIAGLDASPNDMRCVAYNATGRGPFHGRIECRFVNSSLTLLRVGSGLETVQTDLYPTGALEGQQIEVSWDGAGVTPAVTVPPEEQTQSGVITITSPQSSLLLSRIEPRVGYGGATQEPGEISQTWVNKTNSTFWQGGNAGTWLCEEIDSDPNGMDGVASVMSYSFRYREAGWDQEAVYIWRATGQPAPGLIAGVGRKVIQVQGPADFNLLGF